MYLFQERLVYGVILRKKNRFVAEVRIKNNIVQCHYPVTGRVGNIVFENIPCLLTPTNNVKTQYTIEAISLNDGKNWIGINQIKANKYIVWLIKTNQLPKMINTNGLIISRERKIGNSRLDFIVGNTCLEVKTPLIILPLKASYVGNNVKFIKSKNAVSTARFFKHLDELSANKSILVCFYMFEAEPFVPPNTKNVIADKIHKSINNGVDMWQVNCRFSDAGVELVDYYRCHFDRR